jgi:hypothetical protein
LKSFFFCRGSQRVHFLTQSGLASRFSSGRRKARDFFYFFSREFFFSRTAAFVQFWNGFGFETIFLTLEAKK